MLNRTLALILALLAAPSAALLPNPQFPHVPTALQRRGGLGLAVVARIATGRELAHSTFTVLPSDNDLEVWPGFTGSLPTCAYIACNSVQFPVKRLG